MLHLYQKPVQGHITEKTLIEGKSKICTHNLMSLRRLLYHSATTFEHFCTLALIKAQYTYLDEAFVKMNSIKISFYKFTSLCKIGVSCDKCSIFPRSLLSSLVSIYSLFLQNQRLAPESTLAWKKFEPAIIILGTMKKVLTKKVLSRKVLTKKVLNLEIGLIIVLAARCRHRALRT